MNFEINHLVISFVLVISSILVYFILASKLKKQNKHNVSFENMFICGGIIYVSTFLVAANWDYRLVFISFCFPYMSIQNNFFKFLLTGFPPFEHVKQIISTLSKPPDLFLSFWYFKLVPLHFVS